MTQPRHFDIFLTDEARADLLSISDMRSVRAIEKQIDGLEIDADRKGKALTDDLRNFRSIRAAGQRYRVIYQVAQNTETLAVIIVVIGIRKEGNRKDVYNVASKRLG